MSITALRMRIIKSAANASLIWLSATPLFAQDQPADSPPPAESGSTNGETPAATTKLPTVEAATEADFVPRKAFTKAERQAICRKHEGRLIAYYSEVYKVSHCVRRPILSNKTIYSYMHSGQSILEVDGDVIAAIREGEPLDLSISLATARSCGELEHKYVTFSNVDVYYVEKCRKRIFPDWTTYMTHRKKTGNVRGEILSLSLPEFERLADGEPIASVVDDMFAKLLRGEAQVDVIPVDEACAGLNGKVVAYYARLYRIENCRKREILQTDLFFKNLRSAGKVRELSSEQWLSLPNGRDIDSQK